MSSKFGKKVSHRSDNSPEAGPSKRDQYSSDEDEEPSQRKGGSHQCSKMSKHGHMSKKSPGISQQTSGHGHHNKPAELFRKDLISAMKLADTEILYDDEYFTISDPWRQEWEKGVQVPVNEEEIPPITIVDVKTREKRKDFKMPVRKYLHEKSDETYQAGQHELTGMLEMSEQIVRYDLDDQDVTWLELVNEDREEMGLQLINEWNMERIVEELENQSYSKTNSVKKTEEGLGIEYDEDIACDVCRQLESEDTNEMVFCDGCDICVHQACYGIQTIPEGSWLCRICALSIKPMCLLCPKRGGAMKSTKSGTKWTHVSCALWIPEVSIGCPEKMEPITKISNIPASRWALICCLCKERVGACIQCSVKQCKTAFHVTCGFAHNLDMKTVLDDTDEEDGIHLRALCPKHTKNRNASDFESPKKSEEEEFEDHENEETEAEMVRQRVEKLKQLEEEFYTLVDIKEIATKFYIPEEAVSIVADYWKMKRKVNFNKPLITPKMEEENQMQKQQKDSLSARMKMFVHLRQDLERARNLCYMIGKREKTKKQLFKLQESVFRAQVKVLTDPDLELVSREAEKIRQLYQFESIYSSSYHHSSVSKMPRKNLFTLENLKTPKDLIEERNSFNEVIKKKLSKKMSSSKKHSKHTKHEKHTVKEVKTETVSDAASVVSEDNEKINSSGDKLCKFLSDTTADSSENEFAPLEHSKTDSAQMSHLGKVKGSEEVIEEPKQEPEESMESQKVDGGNKWNAGSDLKMKLTSILQSKSLKQKQDKLNHSDAFNSMLYVNVENTDDVFSSDANTDFASPTEQSRNLFDKFKMKPQWSSPSEEASPDIPSKSKLDSGRAQKGKKKHKFDSRKSKQSKLTLSLTKVEDKEENTECASEIKTEKDDTLLSPHSVTDSSDGEVLNKDRFKTMSPSKLSLYKKKSSKDWSITSPHDNTLSSPRRKKISPSPRVDPDNIYGTIDGDIYVPSGKIQVTERTIVLESPRENKTKGSNKLRLKKQVNSPIKGVVSYEVVNNDFDERSDIFKSEPEEEKETSGVLQSEKHVSEEDHHSSTVDSLQKTDLKREKKSTHDGKYLSRADKNISFNPLQTKEVKKDLFGITENLTVNKRDKKLKQSLRSKDLDSSSDENFVPTAKAMKLSSPNRSRRLHRDGRASGLISPNSNTVIKPFPNRPELNALVDPSKLVVKDPLKRKIGDKLSQIVKSKGRWGHRLNLKDKDQRTLDSFVKRTTDRVSSSVNDIKSYGSPLTRADLKTMNTSISGSQTPPKNNVGHLSISAEGGMDKSYANSRDRDHPLSVHKSDLPHLDFQKDGDNCREEDVLSDVSVDFRNSGSEAGDKAETPRRSSRSRVAPEDSQSPLTPSRLRKREGLAKPSVFKSS